MCFEVCCQPFSLILGTNSQFRQQGLLPTVAKLMLPAETVPPLKLLMSAAALQLLAAQTVGSGIKPICLLWERWCCQPQHDSIGQHQRAPHGQHLMCARLLPVLGSRHRLQVH